MTHSYETCQGSGCWLDVVLALTLGTLDVVGCCCIVLQLRLLLLLLSGPPTCAPGSVRFGSVQFDCV